MIIYINAIIRATIGKAGYRLQISDFNERRFGASSIVKYWAGR